MELDARKDTVLTDDELQHYGVLGMKWGVRRSQKQLAKLNKERDKRIVQDSYTPGLSKKKIKRMSDAELEEALNNKKKAVDDASAAYDRHKKEPKPKKGTTSDTRTQADVKPKKKLKDMTDDELKAYKERLQLEDDCKKLINKMSPESKILSKDFVVDIVSTSGKNVATQFVTYAGGTAINKLAAKVFNDPAVINPKKGQKDK